MVAWVVVWTLAALLVVGIALTWSWAWVPAIIGGVAIVLIKRRRGRNGIPS